MELSQYQNIKWFLRRAIKSTKSKSGFKFRQRPWKQFFLYLNTVLLYNLFNTKSIIVTGKSLSYHNKINLLRNKRIELIKKLI